MNKSSAEQPDSHTQTESQINKTPSNIYHAYILIFSLIHSIKLPFPTCSPQTGVTGSPQQRCAATVIQLPRHGTWDFNLQSNTVHYSAHYMQRATPMQPQERTPRRKFLHRSINFKLYVFLLRATDFFSSRPHRHFVTLYS